MTISDEAKLHGTIDDPDLLRAMRCNVVCSHVATMPIPLYERMKAAILATGEVVERSELERQKKIADVLRSRLEKYQPKSGGANPFINSSPEAYIEPPQSKEG